MVQIAQHCPKLISLNLSGNSLPTIDKKLKDEQNLNSKHLSLFVENLLQLLEQSNRLADLDLSNMNWQGHVVRLTWHLAKNKTL